MYHSPSGYGADPAYPSASGDTPRYDSHDPYAPDAPSAPYHPSSGSSGDDGTYEPRSARRLRRRPAVIAGAALLALVVVPFAVDRVVAASVEGRTAKAFQDGMNTPLPPEVHVHGFPVLTQVASSTLRRVDITAHDIPAYGYSRPLPVSELSLRLEGLRKSDDDREAWARTAEATAYLSYPDVSNTLGLEVSQGDRPGQVSASVLLPPGHEVTVTATVSAASGNRIAFTDFQVTGAPLPAAARALLDKVFEKPIRLENIPEGLHLRTVTTTANGLSAHFSGRSVTFHPDGAPTGDAVRGDAVQGDSVQGNTVQGDTGQKDASRNRNA